MALAITYKGKIASTTAATSYTATTSWTPAANSLLVAFVVTCLGSSPIDPTSVTGHGATYSKVTGFSAYTLSTTHLMSIWVAKAGGSPTNAAATASYGAVSQTGGVVIEYEVTDADLAGTALQAILQTVTATGTSTSHTGTNLLAAAGSTDNRALAFYVHLANEATTPAGGNWTETAGADGNFASPATGAEVQHTASTFDRTPAASWTTSSVYRVFAIEIKRNQAVNVTLAGLEATTAQSSPGSAHTNALAGLGASVERGDPYAYEVDVSWAELQLPAASGGDVTANPTGQAATAAQGAFGVAHTQALAGQQVTVAQGTLTAQIGYQVALTGQAVTVAQGSFAVAHAQPLAGLEAMAAQGGIVSAHAQALTGQEATVAAGALGILRAKALTGLEATAAGGALATARSVPLVGLEMTAAVGTLTPTTTTDYNVTLTGIEVTALGGALAPVRLVPLAGLEATAAAGSLAVARSVALAGLESSLAQGALTPGLVVSLTGQTVTISQGNLTPETPNAVVVQLGGLQVAVEQGAFGVERSHPLLGLEAVVEAGNIVVGAPVVAEGGPQPSGGWFGRESPYVVLRRQIEAERQALAISKRASVVIERVARSQARRTELVDEVARTTELVNALERAGIAWQQQFDAALEAYRGYLMTAEIAMLLEAKGIYAEIDRKEAEYYNAAAMLLLLTEH